MGTETNDVVSDFPLLSMSLGTNTGTGLTDPQELTTEGSPLATLNKTKRSEHHQQSWLSCFRERALKCKEGLSLEETPLP